MVGTISVPTILGLRASVRNDPGAGLSIQRIDDRLGLVTSAFPFGLASRKAMIASIFGPMLPERKWPSSIQVLRLAQGHFVQPFLIRLVEVDRYLLNCSGDEEKIGFQLRG